MADAVKLTFPVSMWVGRTTANVLILAGGLSMLLPFFWMFITSFKGSFQAMKVPFEWIPEPFVWTNYLDGLQRHFVQGFALTGFHGT